MPSGNPNLLDVIIDDHGIKSVHYYDYKRKFLTRVDRLGGPDDAKFRFIRSNIETPSQPDFMDDQNPSNWDVKGALRFAQSTAESATESIILINGKGVDLHEFKRRIFNEELKLKMPVEELEELKKAGNEIAKTIDKITKDHIVTQEEYMLLQNIDSKRGGKLHL